MVQMAKPLCQACGSATGRQGRTLRPAAEIPAHPSAPVLEEALSPEAGQGDLRDPVQEPMIEQSSGLEAGVGNTPRRPGPGAPAEGKRPQSDANEIHRLYFHGKGSALFVIFIINIFRTILTLGVYHFWGKVKIRQFIWSETEFKTDRLAYHGTGKELLIGSIKASILIGILYGLDKGLNFQTLQSLSAVKTAGGVLYVLAFLGFVSAAIAGSYRYRLSRTSWRGVRFSFRGKILNFTEIFFSGIALTFLTFGIYYPFFVARQYAFLVSNTYFGDHKMDFDGKGNELFKTFIPFLGGLYLVLGGVLVIGIAGLSQAQLARGEGGNFEFSNFADMGPGLGIVVLLWYLVLLVGLPMAIIYFRAASRRFLAGHTLFGQARFHSTVTTWKLLRLYTGNVCLFLFTAGLAYPWILIRNYRFTYRYMTATGPLFLEEVHQETKEVSTTGEGIGGFLEIDSGLGIS